MGAWGCVRREGAGKARHGNRSIRCTLLYLVPFHRHIHQHNILQIWGLSGSRSPRAAQEIYIYIYIKFYNPKYGYVSIF